MLFDHYKEQQKQLKKTTVVVNDSESQLRNQINIFLWTRTALHLTRLIDKERNVIKERHEKKLLSLKIPVKSDGFNNKLVYNFSYRVLTPAEESLLSKGWKYAVTVKKLNVLNMKCNLEYMYNSLQHYGLLKGPGTATKIKGLLNDFGLNTEKILKHAISNLSKEETEAITLSKDSNLVISKVDKGNAIVVLNKDDYLSKAQELLNDQSAFKKLNSNLTIKREHEFINFLLELKRNKLITEDHYKIMRPRTGSRTPEAYFLVKVHKNNLPLRPIISSYDSYNYNTAKYLANLLTPALRDAPSYVKDTFDFVDKIQNNKQMPGLLCSLDVSSLFTNVPLEKAIPIAIEKIRKYHPLLPIDDTNLKELFYYCTKTTNFKFNNENYD
ncbi:unnamed protein product [Didymodactylos carnosus]|uniref:Reverse transcriptase domain-containing protein n=1 Tax=Didymodactylos carnosus TaxID=1234261 RepID=A0A815A8X3_9BILA|nr:unnamed protein product [Didymodactylos carnosus]CAF4024496.1 unnamed protein product [Didymodactylos carnosus]